MQKTKSSILVVDDNEHILNSLKILLKPEFDIIETIKSPNLIPNLIRSHSYDLVLLDMNFSAGVNTGNEGLFWQKEILKYDPNAIIVLITAYGDVELAVRAIKEGATDFVMKPWDSEKLLTTLQAALKLRKSKLEVINLQRKQKHLVENQDKYYNNIIGSSDCIKDVLSTINKVADTEANVLILGENGTGKELIAREVHKQSKRVNEVFISIDMASLHESLFESELFGHKKGAFTDARENRPGRFEIASGGTLFMDEIGNLPMSLQSKLLVALQNREITPLGSNDPIQVDIRLISATNKNLNEIVSKNLFREDLLYRINTIQIQVPPLRDRGDDILLLSEYFLKQYSRKYEKPLLKINSKAVDKLKSYHWPGNVRELKHTIEKTVILNESDVISPDSFLFDPYDKITGTGGENLNLSEIEKHTILKAIKKHRGNISRVSKELGITRTTLYSKINKFGI